MGASNVFQGKYSNQPSVELTVVLHRETEQSKEF